MESRRGDDAPGAYAAYVGLDVHKDTVAVAVAEAGREAARYCGEIAHRSSAVAKLARDLAEAHGGEPILFRYEAGRCGYGLYRLLRELGFDCDVVAPSRIPKAPAERIKTDRRDARRVRLLRDLRVLHYFRSGTSWYEVRTAFLEHRDVNVRPLMSIGVAEASAGIEPAPSLPPPSIGRRRSSGSDGALNAARTLWRQGLLNTRRW